MFGVQTVQPDAIESMLASVVAVVYLGVHRDMGVLSVDAVCVGWWYWQTCAVTSTGASVTRRSSTTYWYSKIDASQACTNHASMTFRVLRS